VEFRGVACQHTQVAILCPQFEVSEHDLVVQLVGGITGVLEDNPGLLAARRRDVDGGLFRRQQMVDGQGADEARLPVAARKQDEEFSGLEVGLGDFPLKGLDREVDALA
jgi:hypothetical protein